MPFEIIRADLTQFHAAAIVNAANTALQQGGGVCGAIFAAAGAEKLQQACDRIGGCPVGEAVITDGYDLPARYIIHTVGPIWHGGTSGEEEQLARCYASSLALAKAYQLESIAFPLISTGIYRFPKEKALTIATAAISAFLAENEMQIFLVVFDAAAFALSEKRFASVRQYIDDHYIERYAFFSRPTLQKVEKAELDDIEVDLLIQDEPEATINRPRASYPELMADRPGKRKRSLEHLVKNLDESFSQMLLRLIDAKGRTDVEIYKRANIDRKLFSKIRSDRFYKVSKPTAIALAIALELNLDETRDLLAKAGFALSHSSKFDVIVEYFIKEGIYDIFEINETLFAFDQALLGASMSLAMRPE